MVSAFTTPTSVTCGRSNPFASICVPTITCASPERMRSYAAAWAPFARMASRSRRITFARGTVARTSSSTRCVPTPSCLIFALPHAGQRSGALRQRQRDKVALASCLVRDHARRRASEHHRGSGDPTELERGVDRVIAGVAFLLVRGLLLLVDH